ncbi:MAG: hypothetical protein ACXW6R_17870, partial [Candidatus Binatia bacterium]
MERLEPLERGTRAKIRALSAPMIRQIFAQPLIPSQVYFVQRRHMAIIAAPGFNQRDDPEIDLGEMRIGAKVIAHNHRTFSFQLGQSPIHLIL